MMSWSPTFQPLGTGFAGLTREEEIVAFFQQHFPDAVPLLPGLADEFLTIVNRDRPEHLEAILAPSIVPVE